MVFKGVDRFCINNPEKSAKLPEALDQYGPMPVLATLKIKSGQANYLYHQPVESPDWYATRFEEEKARHKDWKPTLSKKSNREKEFALKTKGVLGKISSMH
ncbi:MAG: hypothetical protein R3B47_15645 [Bacteroidia bacterium]